MPHDRSNAILLAAALTAVLLVSTFYDTTTPALAQSPDPRATRWQVVTIQRSGRDLPARVAHDAILVDSETGQTWIMTNAEGVAPGWERVPQK